MTIPLILTIVIIAVVIILALPAIISTANSLYSFTVNQGPKIVESVKQLCNIENKMVSQLIDAVEKQSVKNEKIENIIEMYRRTGEITDCDVQQLIDTLDQEQRKKLNLNEVVCNTLSCFGN